MVNIPERIAMPTAFAGANGATKTLPANSTDDGVVSFQKGFGTAYSAAHSSGGKYVTRAEMNGFGYAATADTFFAKCGGVNAFDTAFANLIGGYPYGAVLDYIVGTKIFKVMSLVPNNLVDFTTVGIDGVNWVALNQDDSSIEQETKVVASIATRSIAGMQANLLDTFIAPKDGVIYAKNVVLSDLKSSSTSLQFSPVPNTGSHRYAPIVYGNYIAAKKIGTVSSAGSISTIQYPDVYNTTLATSQTGTVSTNGWTILDVPGVNGSNGYVDCFKSGTTSQYANTLIGSQISRSFLSVSKGDIIAVCYVAGASQSLYQGWDSNVMTVQLTSISPSVSFDLTYIV